MSMDTACSSALVAIDACSLSLQSHHYRGGLASSTSLKLVPHPTLLSGAAGMLSLDGRCKTFDARANGYVRSESYGGIMLVERADTGSLLSSSSVRQDGRSASLTAPNGSAQRTLLQTTWARAGIAGRDMQSIETHGTGTALGDPTEAGSLASSRGAGSHEMPVCIGAAKAFIGHGEAPSGMSGMLKLRNVLLSGATPGNAYLRTLNPLVNESAKVLRGAAVLSTNRHVNAPTDPSGVSSFGFSGTIAHATLRKSDAYDAALKRVRGTKPALVRKTFGWVHTFPWTTGEVMRPTAVVRAAPVVSAPAAATGNTVELSSIVEMAASVVGGDVDADVPLMSAGLDSLGAVELSELLQKAAGGAELPGTLVFDVPTARKLVGYLATRGQPKQRGARAAGMPRGGRRDAIDVLILGLATQIPGGAHAPKFAWQMMADGHSAISQVPAQRWGMGAIKVYGFGDGVVDRVRHGGFIRQAEMFDAKCFTVSPAEATAMDPQQRLLLERGYEALSESGLKKPDLDGNGTGVFIGIQALDFQEILRSSPAGQGVFAATGCNLAVSSGRVSYVLGMQGPCASYDTACSAGLVAAEAALRALQLGGCPNAMASGVNIMLVPATSVGNGVAGMTSPRGRCHTFDSRADGYCRGDAVCAIAMHARKGVSRMQFIGCAVRQDGRSASLTAPNGMAQEEVFLAAHANSGIDADQLINLEAHGTGTALGDPIEARSLMSAILDGRDPDNMISLSSVKANIGHAEPGAGLSGFSKLLLSVHHKMAPINAQLRVMNTHVRAAVLGAPCMLPTQTADLGAPTTFAAGVSSFGYSGTIVHANVKLLSNIYHPPQRRVRYNRVAFRWSGFETRAPSAEDDCDAGLYHYVWEPKQVIDLPRSPKTAPKVSPRPPALSPHLTPLVRLWHHAARGQVRRPDLAQSQLATSPALPRGRCRHRHPERHGARPHGRLQAMGRGERGANLRRSPHRRFHAGHVV